MTQLETAPDHAKAWSGPPQANGRLHDLDALRGFAMVLGIGLHASLAFFPAGWPALDSTADEGKWFDEFEQAVHGFRMPLFFLLSGFFTTMVWRRRGLRSLARQRALRVVAPFAIGVLTIVPLVDWVSDRAFENGLPNADLATAIGAGEDERVAELVAEVSIDDPTEEGTALHQAAYLGHLDVVSVLLEAGATADARVFDGIDPDGRTPLENAIIGGHEAIADRLVAAGAEDPRLPGETWRELPGWALAPPDTGDAGGLSTDLHHLWFLWYLTFLVIGFLVIAAALDARERLAAAGARWSGPLLWALIPATFVIQYGMTERFGRNFGPSIGTTFRPSVWGLLYYAVFFAFGALLYGRPGSAARPLVRTLGTGWPFSLGVALLFALPIGLDLIHDEGASLVAAVAVQVVFTWLMIFGLMGLFHRFLAVERRGVRYLSDSAYWLYLAHYPLVVLLQDMVRDWDLAPEVKFVGICAVATAILLATYQVFVRYTPVGWLLNGRRAPTRFDLPWIPRSDGPRAGSVPREGGPAVEVHAGGGAGPPAQRAAERGDV